MHPTKREVKLAIYITLAIFFISFVIAACIDTIAFGGIGQDAVYGTGI